MQSKFENKLSKKIYDILDRPATTDLASALGKENLKVEDDMILLKVGQMLVHEKKFDKALMLHKFYTINFPNIVIAWNNLGDIYQSQNNTDEAIKCYTQALKIRPENQRAKESLNKLKK